MTTTSGKQGSVSVGVNVIAEVTGFTLEESMSPEDDSKLGDVWDGIVAGTQNWSVNLECWWDKSDTNGQQALALGAEVALNLFGDGTSPGDTSFVGNALITGRSRSWARGSTVGATFSLQGNGVLTETTVT